jgi:methylthioribose-1-phosphate isomerase
MGLSTGDNILIEERSEKEVTHINGVQVAPDGARAFNPAFDVTPHRYLTAIITERGLVREPFGPGLSQVLEASVG